MNCWKHIFVLLALLILASNSFELIQDGENSDQMNVASANGNFDSKMGKPLELVNYGLAKNFHFVIADVNSEGNPTFQHWTPTANQIQKAAETMYANPKARFKNQPSFNLKQNARRSIDNTFTERNADTDEEENSKPHADSQIPPNAVSFNQSGIMTETELLAQPIDITPELIFVTDYELSQVFEFNYQRILEYYIPFMWDISMKYRTLPSTRVSLQLNGIVVIASPAAQPFVEESRAEDGRVENGRMLGRFSRWVAQNLKQLPPLDYASLATNAKAEWGGGLAWVGPGCHTDGDVHYGTHVYQEGGNWGALGVFAHELGHNLGSGHDGDTECKGFGNIMGGESSRFYFSRCTDEQIGNYARHSWTQCIRDPPSDKPATDPEYSSPLAPTAQDQCRRRVRKQDAWTTNENCYKATCNWKDDPSNNWWWLSDFQTMDNTPCPENGRCFRGKCRKPSVLLKNVASGLCMEAENNFAANSPVKMVKCPKTSTPLSGFVLTPGSKGFFLETAYINANQETDEKCIITGNRENDPLRTDQCGDRSSQDDNSGQEWELVSAGRGQFNIRHLVTRRCATIVNNGVGSEIVVRRCNTSNSRFRWTRA